MRPLDAAGHPLAGARPDSTTHFETAAPELRRFINDPAVTIGAALAAAPDIVTPHALKGYLHLLGTEPAGLPAWSGSIPGDHAVLGMHAFGLEETGDFAKAQKQGRACVGLDGTHRAIPSSRSSSRPSMT